MRFFVTGGSGFLGKHVIHSLLKRDHEIVSISTSQQRSINQSNLTWVTGDLNDRDGMRRLMISYRPSSLIHCAWDTTPGNYWTTTANLNWVAISLSLFQHFAEAGGRRIVAVGTSAEYTWSTAENLDETKSEVNPMTLYGVSKDSLRRILEAWVPHTKTSWTWARLFCPYGPGEKPARLVPRLIHQMKHQEFVDFDSGALIRDFMAVEDVAEALVTLAESDLQGPVNVASGEGVSIRQLATLIAKQMGTEQKLRFGVRPDPLNEPARIVASVDRLHNELKWHATHSMEQRLAQTCRWWQVGGNT